MNILRLGDCLEVMKGLHDGFVDTIITDPPYGLSFMGKKWDYDVPSIEIWQECLRVLKPGGTLLCFAGSRTQHRMACNVEDAGFILKDCIMWLYGSGFPKATDMSKQIDKAAGAERAVVGKNPNARNGSGQIQVIQKDYENDNITSPATEAARLWDGWKSHGLKPAYEPILVAMKPNEGTYANNALVHGVSGLNIDGGRIPTEDNTSRPISQASKNCPIAMQASPNGAGTVDDKWKQGRYPANIILDAEAGAMLDEQSGELKSGSHKVNIEKGSCNIKFNTSKVNTFENKASSGGASRFFYCAKASKKERNAGCENLKNEKFTAGNYSQSPTCKTCNLTLNGTNDHSKCSGEVYYKEMKSKNTNNHHPTVKPLALMEYLCTLTKTPTGGIVLDPFMGSGTTGVACKKLNRTFVGIEKDPAYFEIAKQRINNA